MRKCSITCLAIFKAAEQAKKMLPLLLIASILVLILCSLLVGIYFRATNGICNSDVDLSGKTILITGGNTGIGREYVKDMARRNAKIIMACRNVTKARLCVEEISREIVNADFRVEHCDLSSLESVRNFCDRIKSSETRLDYLICFAAATGVPVDEKLTQDGFEIQFQCNYLSHFLIIHSLLDLLSEKARIILTSSSAHLFGKIDLENMARFSCYSKHPFLSYGDSKLALVMLAKDLSERLSDTGIVVNSFHPGTVYTDGIKKNQIWYLRIVLSLIALLYGKSHRDGAQTLIYLTVSDSVTGITGCYFADCAPAPYHRSVDDKQLRLKLWNLSCDLIKPYVVNEIKI